MPDKIQLLKYKQSAFVFLQFFFDALGSGKLTDFLKSDEYKRFIHEMHDGNFGGKLPDGQPGSKIPGTGKGILDIVHEIFHSFGSDLGETDLGSGDVNPASGRNDDQVDYERDANGTTTITVHHANGRSESYIYDPNGDVQIDSLDGHGGGRTISITRDRDGSGGVTVEKSEHSNHHEPTHSIQHLDRHGNPTSPGEDGGADTNSSNNPLHNINILGPQSTEHIVKAYEHPDKNHDKLDPNKKTSPLTGADKERLGRTIPATETLDPNSGIDPLTQLNLDPEHMKHKQNEDNKELDPNTGLKPQPHPVKAGG